MEPGRSRAADAGARGLREQLGADLACVLPREEREYVEVQIRVREQESRPSRGQPVDGASNAADQSKRASSYRIGVWLRLLRPAGRRVNFIELALLKCRKPVYSIAIA